VAKCSICGRDCEPAAADGDSARKDWTVCKVTDRKTRQFRAVGFPRGGTVSVIGWKFENKPPLSTVACKRCFVQRQEERETKRLRTVAALRRTAQISGGLLIVLGSLTGITAGLQEVTLFSLKVYWITGIAWTALGPRES
jgi:hypothetical protein